MQVAGEGIRFYLVRSEDSVMYRQVAREGIRFYLVRSGDSVVYRYSHRRLQGLVVLSCSELFLTNATIIGTEGMTFVTRC